jgi:predicted nucleotide-binding protein
MARPTIFIGSATNGHGIAEAVSVHLEKFANIQIWDEGVFGLMEGTLEALVARLNDFDFAILVATLEDTLIKDGES